MQRNLGKSVLQLRRYSGMIASGDLRKQFDQAHKSWRHELAKQRVAPLVGELSSGTLQKHAAIAFEMGHTTAK